MINLDTKRIFLVYFKLLLTAFFWGGTFVAGRIIAGDVGPFSAAFLRFLTASIFLVFFTRKMEGRFPPLHREQILPVVVLGITGVFSYNVCFFKGLALLEAGRASLIIATNPIFISLLAAVIFNERLNAAKVAGILISVIGAVIVISRGDPVGLAGGAGLGWGEVFIFGCVASWVTYSLVGKSVMDRLSPLVSVCYSAMVGALLLFVPACAEGLLTDAPRYALKDWAAIFYLGFFGTVLGFVWYYQGIQKIGPMKASLFINFVPVSAIVLAFLILAEPVTGSLLVGAGFVAGGVYLTNAGTAGKIGKKTTAIPARE
jgi:drug/metabolite transporter (DMT)-like permease